MSKYLETGDQIKVTTPNKTRKGIITSLTKNGTATILFEDNTIETIELTIFKDPDTKINETSGPFFKGIIIQESLINYNVLKKVILIKTNVEEVTQKHETPHLEKWTLHTIAISPQKADEIATILSKTLATTPSTWYADFKNAAYHYIIFPNKIFKVDRSNPKGYDEVTTYGLTLKIPEHQLDFSPDIT